MAAAAAHQRGDRSRGLGRQEGCEREVGRAVAVSCKGRSAAAAKRAGRMAVSRGDGRRRRGEG